MKTVKNGEALPSPVDNQAQDNSSNGETVNTVNNDKKNAEKHEVPIKNPIRKNRLLFLSFLLVIAAHAVCASSGDDMSYNDMNVKLSLSKIAGLIFDFRSKKDRLPYDLDELRDIHKDVGRLFTDPWGNEFIYNIYKIKGYDYFTLESKGADGLLDSDDDCVYYPGVRWKCGMYTIEDAENDGIIPSRKCE